MCLHNPVEARTNNKLYTRYKVVFVYDGGHIVDDGDSMITSPYYNSPINLHDWNDVKNRQNFNTDYLDAQGYHVYVDVRAARRDIKRPDNSYKIVKIQTKYRVATGNYLNWKSEIWRTFKIVKFVGTPDAKELNKRFGYK